MTLLVIHLEQIAASAKSINELEFPSPKIFANALLNNPEITTLIRDTEPHERALFSIDPNAINRSRQQRTATSTGLDSGLHGRKNGFAGVQPMKQSAVSRVLGNDMLREIRQSSNARSHGGVDVEVLLRGAEKLCEVYSVVGATDKIRSLRSRHGDVSTSITGLEGRISQQQSVLARKNTALKSDDAEPHDDTNEDVANGREVVFTEEDFQAEEEDIRELERRKKALEELVSGLEKDLGGLLI